ncbi:MAG: hypothetical protein IPK75_01265 [Acidobacteria bacterium]|nr:hypothetical protein [Acidobacteriota bacterium]
MIRSLMAALALGLALVLSPPAQAQTDPQVAELLQSLNAAVAAIEPDPVEVEALTQKAAALEAELAATRAQLASLETGRAERLAEAQRLWRQLGTFLMVTPDVPPPATGLTLFPTQSVAYQNYNQVYHPIEGAQPGKMPDGFSFAFGNLVPTADGALIHRLTGTTGAAIKWEAEKKLAKTQGHYVTEATIPRVVPGVVYNPLWLYSEGSAEGGHEFDFEYMQGRLEYNLHNGSGGYRMKAVNKDLSGHRVRWEIVRRPGRVTMRATSLTDGWTDELVITPAQVAAWAAQGGTPPNLRFPPDTVPMFPVTELWRCRWADWCGTWNPATPVPVEMILHGYRFDP